MGILDALGSCLSDFDIQDPEHLDRHIPVGACMPRNNSLSDFSLKDLEPYTSAPYVPPVRTAAPRDNAHSNSSSESESENDRISLAGTERGGTAIHYVLELGNFPDEARLLSTEERQKFVKGMTKASKAGGFAPNSLVSRSPIAWYEELGFVASMLLWLGGPLASFYTFTLVLFFGTWEQFCYFLVVYCALSFHPLPNLEARLHKSRYSMWAYRYFSYRLIWSDDTMDKIQASAPWIGAAGPHSVMPFGSLLNIPAINMFVFRRFKGATASVLKHVPMLRYLYLWGAEECSGIFKGSRTCEAFFLKDRKALARWALKHGVPVVPAYSIGNSQAFYSWYDSFGILEWISRKTQVALFLYFGRMGLPIPFRVNVTQLLGAPIVVQKKEKPTDEEVSALHQEILDAYMTLFETHKHALGWGDKELKIV